MTAKEWLLRGFRIEADIAAAETRLRVIRARAGRVKSSAPKAVPGGGGRARGYAEAIDALLDTEAALCREIAAQRRVEAEIRAAVEGVRDARLKALLKYRYLYYMTWPEIAEVMRYDVRTVTRLHGDALKTINAPQESSGG